MIFTVIDIYIFMIVYCEYMKKFGEGFNAHNRRSTKKHRSAHLSSDKAVYMNFKSQSAMEYLMTYGWAILIIAVILAAFFELGVFNPYTFAAKAQPGSCQVYRPDGAGTNDFISLQGTCNGEIPEYAAEFGNNPAYISITNDQNIPYLDSSSRAITLWFDFIAPSGSASGTLFTQTNALDVCGPFNLGATAYGTGISFFLHKCINDVGGYNLLANYNTWNFVAVVYDNSTDTIAFYINGKDIWGPIPNNGMYNAPSGQFNIGGWDDYWPTMAGYEANVQIYNTALSAGDIQALYKEGIGGVPINLNNLVGWWPLNGNANDYSGNGNNGNAINVTFTSGWYKGYSAP